ncbi:MAG: TRAM domain-containing protein, partial [Actinobacteria bacterium]
VVMDWPQLRTTGVAKGGAAIARDADGRVVFVRGALPDEVVRAEIVDVKRDFATAEVREVIEASTWRIEPPCPAVAAGCGGCDLQHASLEGQRALKVRIVEDALTRIARVREYPAIDVVASARVA